MRYRSFFWAILIVCLVSFQGAKASDTNDLHFVLSTIPPLIIKDVKDETQVSGVLWEMAILLSTRLRRSKPGFDIQIIPEVLPWKRAYLEIQNRPNTVMLQMSRTAEREELFTWLVPTSHLSFSFITMTDETVDSLEAARQLERIAVYRGSRLENFLRSKGFDQNLIMSNNSETSAKLLNAGRVDTWYASVQEVEWLHQSGILNKRPFYGEDILSFPLWAVAHPETDPAVLKAVKETLDAMIIDGTVLRLHEKYGLTR